MKQNDENVLLDGICERGRGAKPSELVVTIEGKVGEGGGTKLRDKVR